MQEILTTLSTLAQQMSVLARSVEQLQKERNCPWMDKSEAASYLGLDTTKPNYVRKLSYLVRNHGLRVSESKERKYLRTDVQRIQADIEARRIEYIGYA